jgi:hypothetical protein
MKNKRAEIFYDKSLKTKCLHGLYKRFLEKSKAKTMESRAIEERNHIIM